MKLLVYGAGAVGQAIGGMLAADGHSVDFIIRERYIQGIKNAGLSIIGIFGDYATDSAKLGLFSSLEPVRRKAYDYILITTKSYDTGEAVKELGKIDNGESVVVSMQNGCGNVEKITERFGDERSLAARVITGFKIERPGLVRITVTADSIHIGGNIEGEITKSAVRLAEAINKAGLPCSATTHINRDLLAKLLYNSALNPLGAALGVHYGILGDDPHSRSIMNAVIEEVFAVITAMEKKTHWDTAEEYEDFFYRNQIPATYNHRSSMLQDLEMGKRTEIDALTGYVSSKGDEYGIPTPVCDTMSEIIRFLERNGGKCARSAFREEPKKG
ncbi:MAG: ketopantoate reductase family protein [Candidatus Latescibacterota bacterium]|jgi:2-dehydropantoate 2-reductase